MIKKFKNAIKQLKQEQATMTAQEQKKSFDTCTIFLVWMYMLSFALVAGESIYYGWTVPVMLFAVTFGLLLAAYTFGFIAVFEDMLSLRKSQLPH